MSNFKSFHSKKSPKQTLRLLFSFHLTAKMNASAPLYSYLTPEEHILIRSSCVLLSEESKHLHQYVFWGKVFGLQNDYYVVQSTTLNPYELPVTQYRYLPFLLHHSYVKVLPLGCGFFEKVNSGCIHYSYFVFGIFWRKEAKSRPVLKKVKRNPSVSKFFFRSTSNFLTLLTLFNNRFVFQNFNQ